MARNALFIALHEVYDANASKLLRLFSTGDFAARTKNILWLEKEIAV